MPARKPRPITPSQLASLISFRPFLPSFYNAPKTLRIARRLEITEGKTVLAPEQLLFCFETIQFVFSVPWLLLIDREFSPIPYPFSHGIPVPFSQSSLVGSVLLRLSATIGVAFASRVAYIQHQKQPPWRRRDLQVKVMSSFPSTISAEPLGPSLIFTLTP